MPYTVKGSFCFLPPAQVTVVGSYLLGTCVRPDINVDMAVTMPKVRSRVWGMERLLLHHLQILGSFFPTCHLPGD